jgi:hypothetical protein
MRQICIIVWPCQQAKTSRSTSRELVKSRISIFICGEIQMQSAGNPMPRHNWRFGGGEIADSSPRPRGCRCIQGLPALVLIGTNVPKSLLRLSFVA